MSCKSVKRGTTADLKPRSSAWLLKKINQSKVDAKWLDAKAKIDFRSDEFSIVATTTIRMQKDSAIWMVGKKFGIEGIRALVTPDSVYVINRLTNEYQIEGISFLQEQFNLPMTFYDLQDILLGNAILLPDQSSLESSMDTSHYILKEKSTLGMNKSYTFNGEGYYPEKMYFSEGAGQRTAQLEFGDHRPVEQTDNFSYFRALLFRSPETGTISLDIKFSRVELNTPKSLSFEIPSHYTKVN